MLNETLRITQTFSSLKRANINLDTLAFHLPPELEASEPPEARGLDRDAVRLLVSHYSDDTLAHTQFRSLPDFLAAGDCVVINTSGTLNAAIKARLADGAPIELHLSTQLPSGLWTVELRRITRHGTQPYFDALPGTALHLEGGGIVQLMAPYSPASQVRGPRLWIASLDLPMPLADYFDAFGFPIRYSYVPKSWASSFYQTVYATEPGSAEMPAAGRAFTTRLITRLVAKGVQIVPLILHTGVASLEEHEPPYEEYYRVPKETARTVNMARASGNRIIAVGTTVVRALETVADSTGHVQPGEGWTDLIVTPQRSIRSIDALVTGLHEPTATHLAILEAIAGRQHLRVAYKALLGERYLWHEFGDLHLILP